ncbi:MAG: hypothetical protein SynsKO_44640 [Synoicihabitans sp.]
MPRNLMSLRYEIPEHGSDESRRRNTEQAAEWKVLAKEVTDTDPAFKQWKRRLWTITGICTATVFGIMMYWAVMFYDPDRNYKARSHPYSSPFIAAGLVFATGSYIYSKRIKSIGLEVWAKKRDEEFRNQKS